MVRCHQPDPHPYKLKEIALIHLTKRHLKDIKLVSAALAAMVMLGVGQAISHSGATGVVKQRMDKMSEIGKNMKTIGEMVKGTVPFNGDEAANAAKQIAAHASAIPGQFPEGSNPHPSEALDAIWQDWDRFVEIAENLHKEAEKLAGLARSAQAAGGIAGQFTEVGKTCSACHEAFRLKK